jgi:hypothetical protein
VFLDFDRWVPLRSLRIEKLWVCCQGLVVSGGTDAGPVTGDIPPVLAASRLRAVGSPSPVPPAAFMCLKIMIKWLHGSC